MIRLSSRRRGLVSLTRTTTPALALPTHEQSVAADHVLLQQTEEKARKEMAAKAGGKGPLNTGAQGIKKSGKK